MIICHFCFPSFFQEATWGPSHPEWWAHLFIHPSGKKSLKFLPFSNFLTFFTFSKLLTLLRVVNVLLKDNFLFPYIHGIRKFLGQGLNLRYSRDDTGSLTHWAPRNSQTDCILMGIFSRCIVFPCLKKKKKTQNGLNIFELFLMTYKHLPLNYALNIVILLKTLKQAGDGSPASITITSISGSISSFLTCSFLRQRENFQGKEDPRIILLQG